MLPCAAKVTKQDQLWLRWGGSSRRGLRQGWGAPAGSQVQKTGAHLWLCFSKKEKARFSHPKSSLGIEFRLFWKEDLVFAFLMCRTQAPGTEKKSR